MGTELEITGIKNMFMVNKETGEKVPLSISELSVEKEDVKYNQEFTWNKEPKIVTNLSSEPHTITFENMYVDWVTFYEALFGIQFKWYQKIYLRLLCRLSYFFKTGKWVRRAKYNG